MKPQAYFAYRDIAANLNIKAGDVLLLSSDILKLAMKAKKAEKEFSAGDFIDAFIAALGINGTLLIPAYNFDLEDGDVFNLGVTQPMTGALAVEAMKRDDFIRTKNPLHSFLVCGKDASLLAEMNNVSSFGPDSPFAYLMQKNALMLFAGTSIAEAMTFTHFVEESEQVRYRKSKNLRIKYTDLQGITKDGEYRIYSKKAGWTMVLSQLESIIPDDVIQRYEFNGIGFSSIRCKDAFSIISQDILENKARSIAAYSNALFFRDIIKRKLEKFNLFRTNYGKIRSGKRIR